MSITFSEKSHLFHIRTRNSSYIFGINPDHYLQHLYWGSPVEAEECADLLKPSPHSSFDPDVNKECEEYGFWQGDTYTEPCLKVRFYNGDRVLNMQLDRWEQESDGGRDLLRIFLKDPAGHLQACLVYRVDSELDILARHVELTNTGEQVIEIEDLKSAVYHLPELPKQRVRYLVGKWAGEYQVRNLELETGKFTMESKRGITGPHFNPAFAVDGGGATEQQGEVWYGMLGWSGNWKIDVEKTIFNHVRIVGGINDFDFRFLLNPGECIDTPEFLAGFTTGGYGDMSRKLHEYQARNILPSQENRKIVYNSWEATGFDVEVSEQKKLADKAAELGVELFVVDDGWFGSRNSDQSGLGDWYVNQEKFPNGLEELIAHVNGLGMEFGLWVEPEAVNPRSELFQKHPDWIYRFQNTQPRLARNQYVLNLAKKEVKEYILSFMSDLLSRYAIKFIKWDRNRAVGDPGIVGEPQREQRELWYRHVKNLYCIWDELRKRFPNVEFETCCGGGGRIDLGILRYADECWPSDNTDPYDRLMIQEGFSYFYKPQLMMCWVTDSPNFVNKRRTSLKYRFHSSMSGALGIGADIKKWDRATVEEAKQYIRQYKEIRPVIQQGTLYRLISPSKHPMGAVQYISNTEDEIVVFVFLHAQNYMDRLPRIRLQGLDPDEKYRIGEKLFSGNTLMHLGLEVDLKGDFDSTLIRLQKVAH